MPPPPRRSPPGLPSPHRVRAGRRAHASPQGPARRSAASSSHRHRTPSRSLELRAHDHRSLDQRRTAATLSATPSAFETTAARPRGVNATSTAPTSDDAARGSERNPASGLRPCASAKTTEVSAGWPRNRAHIAGAAPRSRCEPPALKAVKPDRSFRPVRCLCLLVPSGHLRACRLPHPSLG
jgi:hypothetical protein